MRVRALCIFMLVSVMLSGCSRTLTISGYQDITEQVRYTVLHFPAVRFHNIIWRADGVIMALQDEDQAPLRQPFALQGDNDLRYLDLEQDRNCIHTKYRFPTQLPDGRLGFIKWCVTDSTTTYASYMVAYDWRTGQMTQIVQLPLKHFDLAQCFSWNPDMTLGVQKVSNGLTGTLNWLTRIGPEPVHLVLKDGNRAWDLAKDFEENGSIEGGRISCPSWSPNGDQIAVFVSFDAMGIEGMRRLDETSQLVLFSLEMGNSESVISGIYLPEFLEWSPDGTKIAFVGDRDKELWIFDIETSELFLIDKGGEFDDLAWSPDSINLAVIWCNQSECENSEIRQYTLPNPLNQ